MEYLFNKDEMLKLITEAPDGNNKVVININYRHGDAKGIFLAEIKASTRSTDPTAGAAARADAEDDIDGCPNPPGC